MPSVHMGPLHTYRGDSDPEGGFHLLPSLSLAAKGKGREKAGEQSGRAGKRLAVLHDWEQEWQISYNCLKLRGC